MSRFLTPPEPVAWGSRWSATKFTIALWQLLLPEKLLRELVWCWLWLVIRTITITVGWLHYQSFIVFPPQKKLCVALGLVIISALPQLALAITEATPAAPTRLVIPGIALDSDIVPVGWKKVEANGQTYGQWEVDDNLVGWHNLSAPLGQAGNSVLNGHSDVYAQVFRNLAKVEIGDRIIAFAGNEAHYYRIATKFLVQEKDVTVEKRLENSRLISPTADERLTLITCAFPGATHRLIVIAYPETSYRE